MIVGLCGAGVMGRGIALSALQAGHAVVMFDVHDPTLASASTWLDEQFARLVEKKKMTADAAEAAGLRCTTTSDITHLSPSDLIIEAVVEKVDVKHAVLASLDAIRRTDSVLATNTSSISIASLARPLRDSTTFAGLHFFNPAHIMKLVEVIRAPRTSTVTIHTCVEFATGLGKTPVVARDVPGFIVNRIARNFYNEAQRIVMEGAGTVEQVDASLKGLGFRMGPFELMDLIGVGTNLDVTTSQWEQFYHEPRFQPSLLQRQTVDAGMKFRDS